MIASVTFEKTHLERRAATSSRRARRTSAASSGFARGDRLHRRGSVCDAIALAHEDDVLAYATRSVLRACPACGIIGTARAEGGRPVVPASRACIRTTSGTILDREGVADADGPALRAAGHGALRHHRRRLARRSAIYNTREEIDALVRALERVREVFA